MPSQPRLILASSSRYRKELLSRLRLPFIAISPMWTKRHTRRNAGSAGAAPVRRQGPGGGIRSPRLRRDRLGPGCHRGRATHRQTRRFRARRVQLRALAGQTVEFHSALAVTDGVRTEKADIVTAAAASAPVRSGDRRLSAGGRTLRYRRQRQGGKPGHRPDGEHPERRPDRHHRAALIALTSMLARFGLDPLARPGAAA